MFFLGGLNTVLPHLLYLAVFSVFIIIGLCGRTNFSRDVIIVSNANYTPAISYYPIDPDLNSFPEIITDAEQPVKDYLLLTFRVEHIYFDYFSKREFLPPPAGYYYRGPPSA